MLNTQKKIGPSHKHSIELILLLTTILSCIPFSEYLPTTADDYSGLFHSIADTWKTQNRPWWVFTSPIGEAITRSLFWIRWTGGIHVAAYFAQAAAIYYFLFKTRLKKEARLGLIVLLSTKVIGYEHGSPLAYPIHYPLALGVATATGLLYGAKIIENKNITARVLQTSYILIGTLSSLWYEYYGLIFALCGLWSFSIQLLISDNAKRIWKAKKSTTLKLLPLLIPIGIILSLKAIGVIMYSGTPGFSNYDGNSLDYHKINGAYVAESLKIGIQTLLGSSILQHNQYLSSWPALRNTNHTSIYSLIMATLIAIASIMTISERVKGSEHALLIQNKIKVLSLAFLFVIVSAQLALHSLSPKYHQWFGTTEFWSGHTYLNASMAVIAASFTMGIFISACTCQIRNKPLNRSYFALLSISLGGIAYANSNHNLQIAKLISKRSKTLEGIVSACVGPNKKYTIINEPPAYLNEYVVDLYPPIFIHQHEIKRNTATTICADAIGNPKLFSRWVNPKITPSELKEIRHQSIAKNRAHFPEGLLELADMLNRSKLTPEKVYAPEIYSKEPWAWTKFKHEESFNLNTDGMRGTMWTTTIIPAPSYKNLDFLIEFRTGARQVVTGRKSIPIKGSVRITLLRTSTRAAERTASHQDIAKALSPADPRRSYFAIKLEKRSITY